jgi:hypothetical protein
MPRPIPPVHPALAMARLSYLSAHKADRDRAIAKAERQMAALRRKPE